MLLGKIKRNNGCDRVEGGVLFAQVSSRSAECHQLEARQWTVPLKAIVGLNEKSQRQETKHSKEERKAHSEKPFCYSYGFVRI